MSEGNLLLVLTGIALFSLFSGPISRGSLTPPMVFVFPGLAGFCWIDIEVDNEVIDWVDAAFKTFKSGLREETSPVQIFPHHMDLSLSWFSGRQVPGVDPADEESADEQMNFGFVTGDASIPDAYFYVTAYPAPDSWMDLALPQGAYWHTKGWTAAVLPYAAVVASERPFDLLSGYLQSLQAHGAKLMG